MGTRQIFKKIAWFILALVCFIVAAWLWQPHRQGKGLDNSTRYEWVETWPDLPPQFKLGNPTGISIDSSQNLIVFHRANRKWPWIGPMPGTPIPEKTILVINKDNGKLISSWGEKLFIMPHGLTVDQHNNIWVTDVGSHQVFKFSHDGRLLLKLGKPGEAGDDAAHFNQPTDIAVAQDGSFYVSDGYGNSRVIKFSSTGKYLFQWGKKGSGAGEFDLPHGLSLDDKGNVYVADRENNRIQVFDSTGKFLKQWTDRSFAAICAVYFDASQSKLFAADDLSFLKIKHRGSDVFVIDTAGKVTSRWGRSGLYKGALSWYHDLAVDQSGNIYTGDILGNTLQKFRKVTEGDR